MNAATCYVELEYLHQLATLRCAEAEVLMAYLFWTDTETHCRLWVLPGELSIRLLGQLSTSEKLDMCFALKWPNEFPDDIRVLATAYRQCLIEDQHFLRRVDISRRDPQGAIIGLEYRVQFAT